jgi:hypothetical protein
MGMALKIKLTIKEKVYSALPDNGLCDSPEPCPLTSQHLTHFKQ